MFTIKRICEGDISCFESAEWTVGPNGPTPSRSFLEAVEYARNPTPFEVEETAPKLADLKARSVEIQSSEGTVLNGGTAYEIGGVTLIRAAGPGDEDLVLVGANPGNRELEDALGVLVTYRTNQDKEQEVQYDFIYPGEQLYITDRFGNTVQSLR